MSRSFTRSAVARHRSRLSRCAREQQVPEAIHGRLEAREHHCSRAVLPDERRRRADVAWPQPVARVDGALDCLAIEADGSSADARALYAAIAARSLRDLRATDRPDPGHAQIHPLDDVPAGAGLAHVPVAVAETL